jgi:polyhydroxybutyrate depolymerase
MVQMTQRCRILEVHTSMPIDSVVKYWVTKNNCNPVATFSNVPNTSSTDGCTAEHYRYLNGTSGSSVELYKIINGGTHTWPGFPFGGLGTNLDINASKEIWRFFNKYSLSALTTVDENEQLKNILKVYPNPVSSVLNLNLENESSVSYNYI